METLAYILIAICVLIQIVCFINLLRCVIKGHNAVKEYNQAKSEPKLYVIKMDGYKLCCSNTREIQTFSTYEEAYEYIVSHRISGEWEIKRLKVNNDWNCNAKAEQNTRIAEKGIKQADRATKQNKVINYSWKYKRFLERFKSGKYEWKGKSEMDKEEKEYLWLADKLGCVCASDDKEEWLQTNRELCKRNRKFDKKTKLILLDKTINKEVVANIGAQQYTLNGKYIRAIIFFDG